MKQGKRILRTIADMTDLRLEAIPGVPLVEIYGQSRVLIENHCGVMGYGCKEVLVKVKCGVIGVSGDKLCLARMNRERLVITGNIYGVNFRRRG